MASHSQDELALMTIEQAARLLRKKEISPVELVEAALARIERWNSALNAFLTVLGEQARRQARAAERELRRGKSKGPMHGIPIALKDNFWTRGIRTTAGSKILADFVPQTDSQVAARLARAGAILLGKTNMHEFAYGITSENPHYGPAHNPWLRDRISGGSSGGSAAAVAAGMSFGSVGTDTGGSIRVPAALCGIVGLKPTYGMVSLAGVVPLASSFDHAGPIARSVTDACIVFEAIAEKYPKGQKPPDCRKLHQNRPRRIRLGWPVNFFFERLDPEVRRLVEAAAKTLATSTGARVVELPLPRTADSVDDGTNLIVAEANHYHESQGYYPARAAEYGEDVRGHLEWGHQLSAVRYLQGIEKRRALEDEFAAAFQRVDVIAAPTSPIPAPPIGAADVRVAGERETTVRAELLRMTRPANLAGFPAISVPCGFTRQGLPVGLQLIGPRWGEAKLLSLALAYEEVTEWHRCHPKLA